MHEVCDSDPPPALKDTVPVGFTPLTEAVHVHAVDPLCEDEEHSTAVEVAASEIVNVVPPVPETGMLSELPS